ncbi:hypothetical protein FNV43_RR10485 [Rhamnella rubrinervis]|uniref:Uncharacterized protein n=1 Tax=Rhamnella rubrinervis TaxID=2594499 RepID=A0A8K0MGX4_9ROSA|nr:hypothetical protein FNV43_RR10485 [Rhamnella rubrinervis]
MATPKKINTEPYLRAQRICIAQKSIIHHQPLQFRDIHDKCLVLLHRLTSKHKKIKRITKLKKICKKVGGAGLVISLTALLIALLIFAFHSIIGIAAAPALMACSVGLCKKKMETAQGWAKTRLHHEGLGGQLDMAAKGVFILINDFDTMSRMARRLHDEVEHRKYEAGMCVRNGKCKLVAELEKFDCLVTIQQLASHDSSIDLYISISITIYAPDECN